MRGEFIENARMNGSGDLPELLEPIPQIEQALRAISGKLSNLRFELAGLIY